MVDTTVDVDTLCVMYASFKCDKHEDTGYWQGKYKFWREQIVRSQRKQTSCVFDVDELCQRFRSDSLGTPQALNDVVEEMLNTNVIRRVTNDDTEHNGGWFGWMWKIVQKKPDTITGRFFVQADVEERSRRLYEHIVRLFELSDGKSVVCDGVIPVDMLCSALLSDESVTRDRLNEDRSLLLKCLAELDMIRMVNNEPPYVTLVAYNVCDDDEVCNGVAKVKRALWRVDQQISSFTQRISRATEETQRALLAAKKSTTSAASERLKQRALASIRRKRKLESTVERIQQVRDNLETVVDTIEQQYNDRVVRDAYASASTAINKQRKLYKLDADDVTELMDKCAEAVEEAREIDEAMQMPLNFDESVDDDEVSLEYQRMVSETDCEELQVKLSTAPTAPTTTTTTTTVSPAAVDVVAEAEEPKNIEPKTRNTVLM